jgi:transcriptional regulator with XRE-family HTH domain
MTPTEVVAKRVAEIRRRRGWSQEELARRLRSRGFTGMDRSILSKLETGERRDVSVAEVFALAAALETQVLSLAIPGGEDEVEVAPTTEPLTRSSLRGWMTGWEPLPGAGLEEREHYVEDLPREEVLGQRNPLVRQLGRLFARLASTTLPGSRREDVEALYDRLHGAVHQIVQQFEGEYEALLAERQE